jgi:hypothetical protein
VTAPDAPEPIGRTPRQVAGPGVEAEREEDAGPPPVLDVGERPTSGSEIEPAEGPDTEAAVEPAQDAPHADAEHDAASDPDPAAEVAPDTDPGWDAGSDADRDPAAEVAPDTDPGWDAGPDADRDPAAEVAPDTDPGWDAGSDADRDPAAEVAPDTDPGWDAGPDADPDPEIGPGDGFMGETDELRRRWEAAQAGFVDDPHRAVEQADEMVSAAVAALQAHIEQRREDLAETWRGGAPASTDALLEAFQRYRELFEDVLST